MKIMFENNWKLATMEKGCEYSIMYEIVKGRFFMGLSVSIISE